jgi:hypothetical protein
MRESTVSTEIIDQSPDMRASWRPWREITLIMLMIMEVCWVVPWYRSLTPATFSIGISKAFIIFFSMILAAHLIVRFVNYLRLKLRIRQIIMILSLVISLVIGLKTLLYSGEIGIMEFINQPVQNFADRTILIPDEFIVAIAVIIGWWRGISLAQAHVGPNLVLNNFFLEYLCSLHLGLSIRL